MAESSEAGLRVIEGDLDARGMRVALVVSRFNAFITERLLDGAVDVLVRHGVTRRDLVVVRVPGAWEIPAAVARLVDAGGHDAILGLGCLMRGDTIHFDLIAGECAKGLMAQALRGRTAVVFGVLTTDGLEQAIARAGGKFGNKGAEAATAAIEQARLLAALGSPPAPAAGAVERPRRRRKPSR